MAKLPVIVSFGGVNSAGRSSFHQGYRRMIEDSLSDSEMTDTWNDLANLMGITVEPGWEARVGGNRNNLIQQLRQGTLIRKMNFPRAINGRSTIVTAGMLPQGFDPGRYYRSLHHPKGLEMTVFGASDALNALGIEWSELMRVVPPDAVSVYSGASICQLDDCSAKGLFQNPLRGQRISSKMLPFMFPEMSADFINSYMINSTGNTGAIAGACATFLYNLRQAVSDIQHGKARLAIVGSAEAPVVPEIVNGFNVMGALATEQGLKVLDPLDIIAYHRACRPFSTNCGFTIAESAQFLILMDDELAIETGAQIFGAVPDVFINADGNKRSISSPGVGNYITVAKAVAMARHLFGGAGLDQTYVHAHGTGTPQNRVSESHILNEVAKVFGIKNWLVTAIKAYVGHSLGPAAGDQIMAALGVWHDGLIPGIKTIDHIADDVCRSNLSILMDHHHAGLQGEDMLASIINAKGFGGNNASALLLSPNKTMELMSRRYGRRQLAAYQGKRERVAELAEQYNQRAIKGERNIIYRFAECEMGPSDVSLREEDVNLSAFNLPIPLTPESHYEDYLTR